MAKGQVFPAPCRRKAAAGGVSAMPLRHRVPSSAAPKLILLWKGRRPRASIFSGATLLYLSLHIKGRPALGHGLKYATAFGDTHLGILSGGLNPIGETHEDSFMKVRCHASVFVSGFWPWVRRSPHAPLVGRSCRCRNLRLGEITLSFAPIVKKVAPAVVNVYAVAHRRSAAQSSSSTIRSFAISSATVRRA